MPCQSPRTIASPAACVLRVPLSRAWKIAVVRSDPREMARRTSPRARHARFSTSSAAPPTASTPTENSRPSRDYQPKVADKVTRDALIRLATGSTTRTRTTGQLVNCRCCTTRRSTADSGQRAHDTVSRCLLGRFAPVLLHPLDRLCFGHLCYLSVAEAEGRDELVDQTGGKGFFRHPGFAPFWLNIVLHTFPELSFADSELIHQNVRPDRPSVGSPIWRTRDSGSKDASVVKVKLIREMVRASPALRITDQLPPLCRTEGLVIATGGSWPSQRDTPLSQFCS